MSKESKVVGILVPDSFPAFEHKETLELVTKYKDEHLAAYGSFVAAWKGVIYRFRVAYEYSAQFSGLAELNRPPSYEERYIQDHALFSFAVSALSSLECLYFGAYCIGSILDNSMFAISSQRDLRFYPRDVAEKFNVAFPLEKLTVEMHRCLADGQMKRLEDMRNVLAHRGIPPRHHKIGGEGDGKTHIPSNPKELSTGWTFDLEMNSSTTTTPMLWLESVVTTLLLEAREFCNARL